jgi:hypothetical protein
MNSTTKFNKHLLELHTNIIQDFIEKLKLNVPEDFHPLVDEQFKKDTEIIKLNIKNTNKITNKTNKKNTPKKPTKANCWRLFCAFKSKDFIDATQSEKWSLCTPFWAELKLNGGDKYWRDLADQLNSEMSDSLSETSETSDATEVEEPIKAKPTPNKAKSKATPKAKKTAPPKEDTAEDDNDDDEPKFTID